MILSLLFVYQSLHESEYIMPDPEYLSTLEAAAYLGLSRQHLWKLASSGKLGRKFGGSYFFTIAELDAYRKKMKKKPSET